MKAPLLLSLSLMGCIDLPNYEEIDKLRILAVRARRPQVTINEAELMDALVVTPDDEPVELSWQVCAYVGSADTKRACPKDVLLHAGTGDTFEFTVDEATAKRLEALCTAGGDLASTLPEGAKIPECTEAGYPLVVRLTARTTSESAVAVKRVMGVGTLSENRLKNPSIAGFEGLPQSVSSGRTYTFKVIAADPLQETDGGLPMDAGPQDPSLRYSWFVLGADAVYMKDHEDDNEPDRIHLKIDKNAKRTTVWIVVRDQEFGVDWRRLDFDVR